MTAADRPSVTDNARAEAERRWPRLYGPEETLTYPREAVREHTRAGFMAGAEWAAARAETTTATIEDAEEVLHGAGWFARADLDPRDLRGILHDLADAGLLATARTATTEDAALTIRYATLDDGTVELDEVVASNATVHLEKMDTASWWLGIGVNGEHLAVNLGVDEDGDEFAHAEPEMSKVDVELDGKPIASLYPPGLVTSRPLATARTRPTRTIYSVQHWEDADGIRA